MWASARGASQANIWLNNSTANIGQNVGDVGTVIMGGNSVWSSTNMPQNVAGPVLYVGTSGKGTLIIQDNAIVTNRLYMGNAAGSARLKPRPTESLSRVRVLGHAGSSGTPRAVWATCTALRGSRIARVAENSAVSRAMLSRMRPSHLPGIPDSSRA